MFLLRSADRGVAGICMDVGFSGLATVGRVFRDVAGQPPSAYRPRPYPPVPTCFVRVWAGTEPFRRSPAGVILAGVPPMLTGITVT